MPDISILYVRCRLKPGELLRRSGGAKLTLHLSFSDAARAELDGNDAGDGQASLVKRCRQRLRNPAEMAAAICAGRTDGERLAAARGVGGRAASIRAAKWATAKPSSRAAESFTRSWLWNCNSGSRSLSEMQRNVPAEKASAQAMYHCCVAVSGPVDLGHQAEVEDQHADRNRQREQTVDRVPPGRGSSRRGPSAC